MQTQVTRSLLSPTALLKVEMFLHQSDILRGCEVFSPSRSNIWNILTTVHCIFTYVSVWTHFARICAQKVEGALSKISLLGVIVRCMYITTNRRRHIFSGLWCTEHHWAKEDDHGSFTILLSFCLMFLVGSFFMYLFFPCKIQSRLPF